jgi:enoyl-CoA hydratase/carnithine racemase
MTEEVELRRRSMRGARRSMEAQAEFPKPVIAAVNGPAVGLGCSLALGCDLVFMAESAYLADTHVSVGLVCGDGGAVFWPLLMGLLRCKEYLFTGDRIPAALALQYGLANRVFPDAELMEGARAMAERLAAQPPHALQDTKRALNLHLQDAILRAAPFALAAEGESFASDHVRRSVERFTRK